MTEPETVSQVSEPLFNPFAPGFTDDPYPHYARVRALAPVHADPFGYWLLTRYEDVSWLLRAGLSVEDRNMSGGPMPELRESLFGDQNSAPVSGLSMLDRDPPDHTRLRKLVSKAFTPRAIEALRPRITALVDHRCLTTSPPQAGWTWSTPSPSRCRSR